MSFFFYSTGKSIKQEGGKGIITSNNCKFTTAHCHSPSSVCPTAVLLPIMQSQLHEVLTQQHTMRMGRHRDRASQPRHLEKVVRHACVLFEFFLDPCLAHRSGFLLLEILEWCCSTRAGTDPIPPSLSF